MSTPIQTKSNGTDSISTRHPSIKDPIDPRIEELRDETDRLYFLENRVLEVLIKSPSGTDEMLKVIGRVQERIVDMQAKEEALTWEEDDDELDDVTE